ncbi:MAG: HDIG domain-containing protein [Clostridiales bacterium]|nr:HDIG domain-containing protein [Clostridiales bacterium]
MCNIDTLRNALLGMEQPSQWFDSLIEVGGLAESYPEVAVLAGVPQDKKHHPEGSVYIHTMMVVDYAASVRDQAVRPLPFMLSALYHDLGKAVTTQTEKDGRIHSYGHEEAGISIAEGLLRRIEADDDTVCYVKNMVKLHMLPNKKYSSGSRIKSTNQMFDEAVCPEDLLLLSEADHFGRLNPQPYDDCRAWLRDRLDTYHKTMAMPYVTEEDLISYGAKESDLEELLAYSHKLRVSGNTKESVEKAAKAVLRKKRRMP